MRRKQAEFLVRDIVPTSCIAGIIVKDSATKIFVDTLIGNNSNIVVYIDNDNKYFYR